MKKILLVCLLPFSLHSTRFTKDTPLHTSPAVVSVIQHLFNQQRPLTRNVHHAGMLLINGLKDLKNDPTIHFSRSGTQKISTLQQPIAAEISMPSLN